jgi:ABC-2 type transport system permease protein
MYSSEHLVTAYDQVLGKNLAGLRLHACLFSSRPTGLMPIYEQTYRRYEARGPLRALRFWPITREALRLVLARRWFLALLVAAWVPFVVQVARVYIGTRFPETTRILPVDGRLFGELLSWSGYFSMFVTIFGGAGLVANDLRTGAILVYLSRPLTRRDYVVGKLGVLLALNFAVTLAPALALYALSLALAPELFAKWSLAWIGPAIVAQSLAISLAMGLVVLAVSAMSRSARVAGLGFFGLLVGLEAARGILYLVYRRPETALLSLQADLRSVAVSLFGLGERAVTLPWAYPATVLLAVCVGCLLILRSRVRAVEIVR